MRRAAAEAAAREKQKQTRQRALIGASLGGVAMALLVLCAAPGRNTAAETAQAAAYLPRVSEETFSDVTSGRKEWCYTFLILQRDEAAETLKSAAVGMLDRKERSLAIVVVPPELLVESGSEVCSLRDVYARKGAYGVKDQIAWLLGYPVDQYISLSEKTAAAVFSLLDGENTFLPPSGGQSAAWQTVLENTLSGGYIRNRDGIISLLAEESATSLTGENLRWYARELLKLDDSRAFLYELPAEEIPGEGCVTVCREEWLALLNDVLNPYCETIESKRVRTAQWEENSRKNVR